MATWDAFALATAIAGETESIELCVGPLATAVRDPMAMAMGVASVAAIARRPVHLAIGSSSHDGGRALARARAASAPRATSARPPRRCGRCWPARRRATRESWCAPTATGCACRLPQTSLTVAAFGEATVRVAARVADRMVLNLVTPELVSTDGAAPARRDRPSRRGWRLGRRRRRSDTGDARAARTRPGSISGSRGVLRHVHRSGVRGHRGGGAGRGPPGTAAGAGAAGTGRERWDW